GGISWPHPSRRAQSRAPPAITAKPLRRDDETVPHAEEHGENRASRSTRPRSFLRPYAVLAAASACALRSLRGTAFSGLLRGVRLATPAASRKRVTRSDGCAPLASQALTLSISSFSRSVLSLGQSGLKWPSRSMKRPSRGNRESATTT